MNAVPILEARQVRKVYTSGEGHALEVLREVNLQVYPGEIIAITGESGSGKSTLLHILGTLDSPTSGEVLYNQQNVFVWDDETLAIFRNQSIGFVFQFHHLLPEFTALENVAMPALIARKPLRMARPRALHLLEMLGIASRADHLPAQLSGGEQQRVAVARALMNAPAIILADEPTGNLDTRTAEALFQEFIHLSRKHKQTFVIVTHNMDLAQRTDRVLQLKDGYLTPT